MKLGTLVEWKTEKNRRRRKSLKYPSCCSRNSRPEWTVHIHNSLETHLKNYFFAVLNSKFKKFRTLSSHYEMPQIESAHCEDSFTNIRFVALWVQRKQKILQSCQQFVKPQNQRTVYYSKILLLCNRFLFFSGWFYSRLNGNSGAK